MTMVGHAPIGVVGAAGKGAFKGVGMVGHGVGHVGNFAGRKIGTSPLSRLLRCALADPSRIIYQVLSRRRTSLAMKL